MNERINLRDLSYDDIVAAYDPATWPKADNVSGVSILVDALRHQDERVRDWLSNRLLDDGADATAVRETTLLHVLLDARPSFPAVDAALVRRLVAGGVDFNRSCGRWGRPVQMLFDRPPEVADAVFEIDGLDLLGPDGFGRSALDIARINRGHRPRYYEQVTEYLAARGQLPTVPCADFAGWATESEFDADYRPEAVNEVSPETGSTVLLSLLQNPGLRATAVPRVLADGADVHVALPDGRGPLHVLFGRMTTMDYEPVADLARALLEYGADPNLVRAKVGTPLNVLAEVVYVREDQLSTVYDVYLAAPGLDPLTKVGRTKTCWDLMQNKKRMRPVLLERVQLLIEQSG